MENRKIKRIETSARTARTGRVQDTCALKDRCRLNRQDTSRYPKYPVRGPCVLMIASQRRSVAASGLRHSLAESACSTVLWLAVELLLWILDSRRTEHPGKCLPGKVSWNRDRAEKQESRESRESGQVRSKKSLSRCIRQKEQVLPN